MTNRIREIDFIRALGALSVIAIHVSGSYIYSSRVAFLWNIGMRYAVPLFVIISGFVVYYVENLKKSFSSVSFWTKRLKKLIIPYVIWNIVYLLYASKYEMGKVSLDYPAFINELEHDILTGVGTYHLYFVLIIIQLSLLFPIIRPVIKKHMNISLIISFIITVYSQTIIYLGVQNKASIPQTYIPFFMLLPVWIFFYIFGMFISSNIESFRQKLLDKKIITGAVFLISYVLLVIDTKMTNTMDLSVKPSVMLYSVVTFIFFYSVAYKAVNINNIFAAFMDFISEQSFLIYLSHVLFLKLISLFSYAFGFGVLWENSRNQILLYITTVTVSCIFAYVMSFMPVTSLFGGVYKRHLSDLYHKGKDLRIEA